MKNLRREARSRKEAPLPCLLRKTDAGACVNKARSGLFLLFCVWRCGALCSGRAPPFVLRFVLLKEWLCVLSQHQGAFSCSNGLFRVGGKRAQCSSAFRPDSARVAGEKSHLVSGLRFGQITVPYTQFKILLLLKENSENDVFKKFPLFQTPVRKREI